jgi:hypothetical protein
MLTMCVELSRDASIQFRIESRSVVPCGIGLLKILSILELGVTKVLLKSGHVERMESNDTQKPGVNAMRKGPGDRNRNCESTRLKWANCINPRSAIATSFYKGSGADTCLISPYPARTPQIRKGYQEVWGCSASPWFVPKRSCQMLTRAWLYRH